MSEKALYGEQMFPIEVAAESADTSSLKYVFGIPETTKEEVKRLVGCVLSGVAPLHGMTIAREDTADDFQKTTITIVLTEKRDPNAGPNRSEGAERAKDE